jgi:hypothetical protein
MYASHPSIWMDGSFLAMTRKPFKIAVSIVGTTHPRFVIVNNQNQFWSGTDWTTDFRRAMLYTDASFVLHDAEELRQKHCG